MANGDTKTNQYLNIAANGTRADLPSDTCCETRSQTLIRGVAERIMDVEDEVEELKNNPDVVDIVDTYADLQAYDTTGLTDKDIIRVLQDETHSGNSTYYRWDASTNQFEFVGEISGGTGESSGAKVLTESDYNWNSVAQDSVTEPFDSIALWLLPPGQYTFGSDDVWRNHTIFGGDNYVVGFNTRIKTVMQNGFIIFQPLFGNKTVICTNANNSEDTVLQLSSEARIYIFEYSSSGDGVLRSQPIPAPIIGSGAPSDLIAVAGQNYIDSTNDDIYICTAPSSFISSATWKKITA